MRLTLSLIKSVSCKRKFIRASAKKENNERNYPRLTTKGKLKSSRLSEKWKILNPNGLRG